MFLLMGPNTGLGHNSMIFMLEAQVTYLVDALRAMQRHDVDRIEVRPEVEQAFRAQLAAKLAGTVWTSGCNSWYLTPDGDARLWPGFTFDYWRRTRRARLDDYLIRARAPTHTGASLDHLTDRGAAAI